MKAYGIAFLLALFLVVSAYFYGVTRGKQALFEAKSRAQLQIDSANSATGLARSGLAEAENARRLMTAQLALYKCVNELDRRNYGFADGYLKTAAAALNTVQGAAGDQSAAVQQLGETLERTDLMVTANQGEQREKILRLAEQMNSLVPLPISASVEAIPSETSGARETELKTGESSVKSHEDSLGAGTDSRSTGGVAPSDSSANIISSNPSLAPTGIVPPGIAPPGITPTGIATSSTSAPNQANAPVPGAIR